jgi:hypothetical protein
MLRVLIAMLVVLGGVLFVACGGDDDDGGDATEAPTTAAAGSATEAPTPTDAEEEKETPTETAAATDVQVTFTDDSLTLDRDTAPAGTVNFHISNEGEFPHTLIIIRTDQAPDSLNKNAQGQYDPAGSSGGETIWSQTPGISAGTTDLLGDDLDVGNYVLISNVVNDGVGDYGKGMYAAFTVE